MAKTIIFKNEMNYETINELITYIEEILPNEVPEKVKIVKENNEVIEIEQYVRKIYFSTNGGLLSASNILVDYINNNTDFYFIFIANNEISSAGFETFIKLKCERQILSDAFSIIHTITTPYDLRESAKKESIQKHMLNTIKNDVKEQLDTYRKLNITEKDIKKMLNGNDVFLDNNKLREVLELTNNI